MKDTLYKDIKHTILFSNFYRKFENLNKSKQFLKSMLNYYKIATSDIYISYKRDVLTEKLINIDKFLTLKQRENIIDKIRFDRNIK
jgi:hypothetical protein